MALPATVEQIIEALEHMGDNGLPARLFDTLPLDHEFEALSDPTFEWRRPDGA